MKQSHHTNTHNNAKNTWMQIVFFSNVQLTEKSLKFTNLSIAMYALHRLLLLKFSTIFIGFRVNVYFVYVCVSFCFHVIWEMFNELVEKCIKTLFYVLNLNFQFTEKRTHWEQEEHTPIGEHIVVHKCINKISLTNFILFRSMWGRNNKSTILR